MSEWIQFFIVLLTMATFLIVRRTDQKEVQKDIKEFREKWAEESKDFLKEAERKRTQILMGK